MQIVLAIGAIMGCFIAPVVGGLWGRRPVYFALCLLSLVSCAYLFRYLDHYDWLVPGGGGLCRRSDGGVLRLVAALSARTVPHARPRNRPGLELQFRPHLAAVGSLAAGGSLSVIGGNYAVVMAGMTLDLQRRLGADLVRPGNQRQTAAGVDAL